MADRLVISGSPSEKFAVQDTLAHSFVPRPIQDSNSAPAVAVLCTKFVVKVWLKPKSGRRKPETTTETLLEWAIGLAWD